MTLMFTLISGLAGMVCGQAVWAACQKNWRNCLAEYLVAGASLAVLVLMLAGF